MKECFEDRAKIITNNIKYTSIKNAQNIEEGAIAAEDYGWVQTPNYADEILKASDDFELSKYDNITPSLSLEERVAVLENQVKSLLEK